MKKSIKSLSFIKTICLSAIIFISACYSSINPIGNSDKSFYDDKLTGVWEFRNILSNKKIEKGYFVIFKSIKNYYQIYIMDKLFEYNNTIDSNFQGYVTQINGENFLSLQPLKIPNGKHVLESNDKYIFANYKINNNTLTIRLLDTNFLKWAIEKNYLKGKIHKNKYSKVTITDSTANIIKVIEKHKKKAFSDKTTRLKKLNFK